ncbi:MAG: sulfur carrier protein ThiS [Deltaproteobacteria bacterium]|nr:MAG: sulfur carrier protein ThiS [Deltaproteobacteria bacterium]
MIITVNGKPEELSGPTSLMEFLQSREIRAERVVIELNQDIVEKKDLTDIMIKENDKLEIVRFVGGG